MAYEHTGEEVYLQRAEANAQAIIDGAEELDGAPWFPYSITHTMHGELLDGSVTPDLASFDAGLKGRCYAK